MLLETPTMIDLSAKMISEGKENELMPREADICAPITTYRYILLAMWYVHTCQLRYKISKYC
jgi:hypothetical protein